MATPRTRPTPRTDAALLTPERLSALRDYVERHMGEGCDGRLTLTLEWAAAHGLPPGQVACAARSLGGYCDCEVILNTVPDPDA